MAFMFRKTHIPYGMFDVERSAEEAKRFAKCERIYHRGQEIAWDGKEILAMLLAKHGDIRIADDVKNALERIFGIIMWGELAAWRIAAQLAEGLVPLEAKMAATSQAHDEARHFYVMHDYLRELGYVPTRMDRAPQALLDMVLGTDNLAYKLVGMQLLIEPLALTMFQVTREHRIEPVLTELLPYFERDEARHVGLGMQYLPSMLAGWSRRQIGALLTFQARLMYWAIMETKLLEKDLAVLKIDPRAVVDSARKKQLAVLTEAFDAMGLRLDRHVATMIMNAGVEFLFVPAGAPRDVGSRAATAWAAAWKRPERVSSSVLDVHRKHPIQTARGPVVSGDD